MFYIAFAIVLFCILPAVAFLIGPDSRDQNPSPAQW
jgi:hypothetical protein